MPFSSNLKLLSANSISFKEKKKLSFGKWLKSLPDKSFLHMSKLKVISDVEINMNQFLRFFSQIANISQHFSFSNWFVFALFTTSDISFAMPDKCFEWLWSFIFQSH